LKKTISFTHVLNTVSAAENKYLFDLQAHTIDSMNRAKQYAADFTGVHFLQVSTSHVPAPLLHEATCMQSDCCITNIPGLEQEKKLPLLLRMLKDGLKADDSEYIVYTNTDIILAPQFYTFVAERIAQGHDAIVINRRRVSDSYLKNYNYDLLVSETGLLHIGYDTFVLKKSLLEKFVMTDICVGVEGACNDLFLNSFVFAENPILLTHQNLTFHIGYELVKEWGNKKITAHNLKELHLLNKKIGPMIDITKFPGSNRSFFSRHFRWLMNPTVSYPVLLKADLKQFFSKRKPRSTAPSNSGNSYYEWMLEKITF
jgi:hypothetical protein